MGLSAEGEGGKMEWIDLRACICRMERSEVRGELGGELGEGRAGALVGRGEGERENCTEAVGETERWDGERVASVAEEAGGMRVRLRGRVETSSAVVVVRTGQVVWERVMAAEVKPKASG